MDVVVDASVAFKWFVAEHGSDAALALRAEHDVGAPDLLLMECRNALLSQVRHGKLSQEQAWHAESQLEVAAIEIVPSGPLLSQAFALAMALSEPIYDCIYLAAAGAAGCRLVTADGRFVAKVARSTIDFRNIVLLPADT